MIELQDIATAFNRLPRKDRIRAALKVLGKRQDDAAEAIGYTPIYLRNILTVAGEPPILDKLEAWIKEQAEKAYDT